MFRQTEVKPELGDLIEIDRGSYQHWAIYIGDGDVIHLAAECEVPGAGLSGFLSAIFDRTVVKKEPFWKVVRNNHYRINNKYDGRCPPLPMDEIISRAMAEVGRVKTYSVVHYNCEHFVTELRYGKSFSDQVKYRLVVVGATIVGVPVLVGLGTMLFQAVARRYEDE